MKSLFTGIDSSSHTAVCSAEVINSFMSLFYLFIYFSVIANFFQIDRLEPSFTDSVSVSVPVSVIPFPDSGFRSLVLPVFCCKPKESYKSPQGTELSVAVVICLLGSF